MAYNKDDEANGSWNGFLSKLDNDEKFRKMLIAKDFNGMYGYVKRIKPSSLEYSAFSLVKEQVDEYIEYELDDDEAKQYSNAWCEFVDSL